MGSNAGRHAADARRSEPHLIEISGRVDLGQRFNHYPTDAEFAVVYDTDCAPQVGSLIGRPLDPDGKFGASGIHPSAKGWADGQRTVWCGAAAISQYQQQYAYLLPLFAGRVEGADQTLLEPVGSCWSSASQYALPCSAPHEWEVTGYVDLTGRSSTAPSEQDSRAWERLVGGSCDLSARVYLGRPPTGQYRASWIPVSQRSWNVGRRKAECTLARYRNSTILTTIGSARQ